MAVAEELQRPPYRPLTGDHVGIKRLFINKYPGKTLIAFQRVTLDSLSVASPKIEASKAVIEGVHNPTRWLEGVIAVVLIGSGVLVGSLL